MTKRLEDYEIYRFKSEQYGQLADLYEECGYYSRAQVLRYALTLRDHSGIICAGLEWHSTYQDHWQCYCYKALSNSYSCKVYNFTKTYRLILAEHNSTSREWVALIGGEYQTVSLKEHQLCEAALDTLADMFSCYEVVKNAPFRL